MRQLMTLAAMGLMAIGVTGCTIEDHDHEAAEPIKERETVIVPADSDPDPAPAVNNEIKVEDNDD